MYVSEVNNKLEERLQVLKKTLLGDYTKISVFIPDIKYYDFTTGRETYIKSRTIEIPVSNYWMPLDDFDKRTLLFIGKELVFRYGLPNKYPEGEAFWADVVGRIVGQARAMKGNLIDAPKTHEKFVLKAIGAQINNVKEDIKILKKLKEKVEIKKAGKILLPLVGGGILLFLLLKMKGS